MVPFQRSARASLSSTSEWPSTASASPLSRLRLMIRAESLIGWVSVLIVLATLLVARGLNVAACSYLVKRIFGIQMKLAHQIVVWYSGLRGAMSNRMLTPAFALGLKALALMKNKEVGYLVYRISVIICFFTVVHPLLRFLS